MLVIAFPCRWDSYMLPMSYSSVLLKEWAPLEDQWTSQDKVSGISGLLWLSICGHLSTRKLTEIFALLFLQSQIFGLTSFWRGARSRQRDTEMLMSLTWPPPGKVALLSVPSSIASGLTSCKWHLWSSLVRLLSKGSVRPARTTLTLCSALLRLFSARKCTPWPGLRGGQGGVGVAWFLLYVLACHLKWNIMCFQRAWKALNCMIYHVCGSWESV